jgi:hypothetical protein
MDAQDKHAEYTAAKRQPNTPATPAPQSQEISQEAPVAAPVPASANPVSPWVVQATAAYNNAMAHAKQKGIDVGPGLSQQIWDASAKAAMSANLGSIVNTGDPTQPLVSPVTFDRGRLENGYPGNLPEPTQWVNPNAPAQRATNASNMMPPEIAARYAIQYPTQPSTTLGRMANAALNTAFYTPTAYDRNNPQQPQQITSATSIPSGNGSRPGPDLEKEKRLFGKMGKAAFAKAFPEIAKMLEAQSV